MIDADLQALRQRRRIAVAILYQQAIAARDADAAAWLVRQWQDERRMLDHGVVERVALAEKLDGDPGR